MMWPGAFEIWQKHPWVGTGLGDPQDDLAAWVQASGSIPGKALPRFHSVYFDSLATTRLDWLLEYADRGVSVATRYFWLAYCRALAANWAEFSALAGVGTIVLYAVAGLTGSWLFNRGLPPYLAAVIVLVSGTLMFRWSDASTEG